jgi:hypothetical protein
VGCPSRKNEIIHFSPDNRLSYKKEKEILALVTKVLFSRKLKDKFVLVKF